MWSRVATKAAWTTAAALSLVTGCSGSADAPTARRQVTVNVDEDCRNPRIRLGDELWLTSDRAPAQWGVGEEDGWFIMTTSTKAVFESRAGGSLDYERLPSDQFDQLVCIPPEGR